MAEQKSEAIIDTNEQMAQRRAKLALWREQGSAYPNDFQRDHLSADLHQAYGEQDKESLQATPVEVAIAGRVMMRRLMGKASFIHLQDMAGQMQVYLRRDDLPEGRYQAFKQWDLGDIVGVRGTMF